MATAAGDLLMHVRPNPRRPVEYNKDSVRRRGHLFRTQVHTGGDGEGDGTAKEATAVKFVDSPLDDLSQMSESVQRLSRLPEAMAMEDLSGSPAGMTRVAIHPSPGCLGLVFAGGSAGLGRVLRVRSLVTEEVRKKLSAGLRTKKTGGGRTSFSH